MKLDKNKLYPVALLRNFLSKDNLLNVLHIRRKPKTLQMPITSKCNSKCVTCNVWKHHENVDIDPVKLKELLKNPYFSEVRNVGVNGGELTLVKNFLDIIDSLFVLPKLKSLYLISNGLLPDRLFSLLKETKQKCDEKGILLNICISVDGYASIHETVRGIPNCFPKTKRILDEFKKNLDLYANRATIGCTISQKNVAYLRQTEEFFKDYPFYVQYHLAVPNKRIHTFDCAESYNVLNDEYSRMLAEEFFYAKFWESKWTDRYAYFCQYYYLKNKGQGRLCGCQYKYRDVTIDENLKMFLCATASDELGNTNTEKLSDILNRKRFRKLEKSVCQNCDTCIHYVYSLPTIKGWFLFVMEFVKKRFDRSYKFGRIIK